MQLAITVLGQHQADFIVEILNTVNNCQCNVLELRTSSLTRLTAVYLMIDGNWNCIAKLEDALEVIAERLNLHIKFLRPDTLPHLQEGVPYTLETISLDKKDLMHAITEFLTERGIIIEEITANRHHAVFFNNMVFSTRFILLVPELVHILTLREEFLDFCDSLNIDAILEPIKR